MLNILILTSFAPSIWKYFVSQTPKILNRSSMFHLSYSATENELVKMHDWERLTLTKRSLQQMEQLKKGMVSFNISLSL